MARKERHKASYASLASFRQRGIWGGLAVFGLGQLLSLALASTTT